MQIFVTQSVQRVGIHHHGLLHVFNQPPDQMDRCSGAERYGNDSGQHGKKSQNHQQCGGPLPDEFPAA